jgi:non-specific serine/threonine protein kinase
MALLLEWIAETRTSAAAEPAAARLEIAGGGSQRGTVLTLVPRPAHRGGPPDRHGVATTRAGALRRDGDVWTFVFDSRTTRVRHMVGLVHLARLLAAPGREVHVAELVAGAYGRRRDSEAPGEPVGDAGELLDARARTDYEARLRDARDDLEEATRLNDLGRSERLRREIEILAGELSRGFGLGGRPRRASAPAERARVAVTRAIKYAVERIAEHDAALAEHLHRAVRTGTFCVYAPSSRDQVAWTLQP